MIDGREAPIALLVLDGAWVDQLYVDPGHSSRGLGTALIQFAKAARPGGLSLWTFERNLRARAFYERHDFVLVGEASSDNEERCPALLYQWTQT